MESGWNGNAGLSTGLDAGTQALGLPALELRTAEHRPGPLHQRVEQNAVLAAARRDTVLSPAQRAKRQCDRVNGAGYFSAERRRANICPF